MKKVFAYALILIMSVIAGCSSVKSSYSKTAETDNNRLVIAIDEYDREVSFKGIFDSFEAEHPEIEVVYELIPDVSTQGYTPEMRETAISRLHTQLMAGKGPDIYIDLLHPYRNIDGMEMFTDIHLTMESGVFCDMKPYLEVAGVSMEDFVTPIIEAGQIDGKQYIVPLHYDVSYMVTNDLSRKVLGGEEGLSGTKRFVDGVSELLEIPGAMSKTAMGWERMASHIKYCINPFYQSVPYIIDYKEKKVICDNEFTRSLLCEIKDILDSPIEYNTPPGSIESGINETWEEFREFAASEGFAVMSRYLEYNASDVGYMEQENITPHIDSIPSEDGGVMALITMYGAVRANSDQKNEATELLKYLLSEDVQKYTSAAGRSESLWPVRKGIFPTILNRVVGQNISLSSPYREGTIYFEENLSEDSIAQFENIENSINNACFPLPTKVGDIINEFYNDERDIDSALDEIQQYLEVSLWAAD